MRKFALMALFTIFLTIFAAAASAVAPVWDANFVASKTVNEGSAFSIMFNSSGNDTLGGSTFTMLSGPVGATFTKLNDQNATFSWTPTFTQARIYAIKLNVSDADSSDQKIFTVTVVDTTNPSSTDPALGVISSQSVNEGKTLTISLLSTAPDNGIGTTFTTNATFGSLAKNSDTSATFTFTPTFTQSGVYSVKFTAADGDSLSNQTVQITVVDVPAGMSASSELSLGSSTQRRSNPRADSKSDREVNVTGSISVTNTGSEAITNLSLLSVSPKLGFSTSDLLVSATFAKSGLAVGESTTATITARIPEKLDAVDSNLNPTSFNVATLTMSASSQTGGIITTTSELKMQAENQLKIKDLDVRYGTKTEDVNDGDTVKDMKPGDKVTVTIEGENKFSDNDNLDIDDITFTLVSDDLDVDEDDDMGSLGPRDTDTSTVEFDLENDAENGRHNAEISLEGRDENGARHGEIFNIEFEVERKSHEIAIDELSFRPSTVTCETEADLTVVLRNIGRDDEDDVVLNLEGPELKFGEIVDNLEIDEDDDLTQHFIVPLRNLKPGNYRVTARTYYENDQFSNDESAILTVRSCTEEAGTESETTTTPAQETEPAQTGIEVVPVSERIPTETPPAEETSFFERPEYITLLVIGIVIALAVVIWLLVSLAKGSNEQ